MKNENLSREWIKYEERKENDEICWKRIGIPKNISYQLSQLDVQKLLMFTKTSLPFLDINFSSKYFCFVVRRIVLTCGYWISNVNLWSNYCLAIGKLTKCNDDIIMRVVICWGLWQASLLSIKNQKSKCRNVKGSKLDKVWGGYILIKILSFLYVHKMSGGFVTKTDFEWISFPSCTPLSHVKSF